MKLNGRNALITGSSQGLGQAIAEHYVRAGASEHAARVCDRVSRRSSVY